MTPPTVATSRQDITLQPTAPFNFEAALSYLRGSPSAMLERISDDGVYRRALTLDGRDLLLTLRSLGTVAAPRLTLEVAGPLVDDAATASAVALVRRIFHMDVAIEPFLALGAGDPIFAALQRRHYGLRPVLLPDPFETLIWAVLGQQINTTFARKLKLALVHLAGRDLVLPDGASYPLAPSPAAIAALDEATLRAHQFSRQKATYALALARAVSAGTLRLEALATLSHDEAIAALTSFTGVGRWTAEYVLMRGLGVRDSIPAGDMGLRNVIGRFYLGRKASEAEVRTLAEAWAGWRGWAAFYWWHALQDRLVPALPPAEG